MRRMSFALTTPQILARTKSVTRRLGWAFLRVGDLLLAVDRQRVANARKLAVLEVVDVRTTRMADITPEECRREGFPGLSPEGFRALFVALHRSVRDWRDTEVRRIEFRYREDLAP